MNSLPPLIYLFGLSGAGKSYVAEIISRNFGYFLYEADSDLSSSMKQAIAQGCAFSEQERDEYYAMLVSRISELQAQHNRVVISQGTYRQRHRDLLSHSITGIELIWIKSNPDCIKARLSQRKEAISPEYAALIEQYFESPPASCKVIENDAGEGEIVAQINKLFSACAALR